MKRLDEAFRLFGVKEDPPTLRIIGYDSVQIQSAVQQGFQIWSPRDMFEYVHLSAELRLKLRQFKRVFSTGGFDWR